MRDCRLVRKPLIYRLLSFGGVLGLILIGGTTAKAASDLTVSPQPNTPDASPTTQISLLGVHPKTIKSVSVRGSHSGGHTGFLRSYSDNSGGSYVLTAPFRAGETVTVRICYITGKVTRATHYSFKVATPGPPLSGFSLTNVNPNGGLYFASEPTLRPPRVSIQSSNKGLAPGYVLLTPTGISKSKTLLPGSRGPLIVDQRGNTVWFLPTPLGQMAFNLRVQRYRGKRVLTWWQGFYAYPGAGNGSGQIYDSAYRRVAEVNAGNGYSVDLHEFTITRRGSALVGISAPIVMTARSRNRLHTGVVMDSIIQEIDIPTGLVKFEWHALAHVKLDAIPSTVGRPPEPYHLNSIAESRTGDLLVSFRDTSALYLIDHKTGKIRWTLGGKTSSFKVGRSARFACQHNAQFVGRSDSVISLFDNEGSPFRKHGPASRGEVLRLDFRKHEATLVREYKVGRLEVPNQGAMQVMANGNVFVGWGALPFFSEFSKTGRRLLAGKIIHGATYRAYKAAWSGNPTYPPSFTSRISGSRLAIYVSWNGATEVKSWRILSGPSAGQLAPITSSKRTGFETVITVPRKSGAFFAVAAVDRKGKVLRTSPSRRVD